MQAIDSARLSLAEFERRAGFSSKKSTVSRHRYDVTTAIKTVLWTYRLRQVTGCNGPYGLERHFEPEAFLRGANGNRSHTNKWVGYAKGRHEPKSVLAAVEKDFPGVNDCLRSTVWAALAACPLPKHRIGKLLATLSAPLQDLIRRHGFWPEKAKPGRRQNTETLTAAIERRASLDALAAVVLLLRLAHAKGDQGDAYDWGGRVWRMMVLLGPSLVGGGIAGPLSELIEQRVMPMATLQGVRLGFPTGGYLRVVAAFKIARARVAKQSVVELVTEWQRQAVGPRLLTYKLGWDFHHAFNPIPMFDDGIDLLGLSGQAALAARRAEEDRWCHEWALNMLTRGGHQNSPPDAARSGADLWAVDPEDPILLQLAEFRRQRSAA